MKFVFDPRKRTSNLRKHGLDLADAQQVIESDGAITFEDRRFEYSEERFVTIGLLARWSPSSPPKPVRKSGLFQCGGLHVMKKQSTAKDFEDRPITRADIAAGRLVPRKRGADGALLPAKQRVNIYLDSTVVEHFKRQAGARGYQTLINESLKNSITGAKVETLVRKAVRAEFAALRRAA